MIANTCAKSNDLKIPGIKTIGIQLIDAGLQYHDSLILTLSSINMVIPEGKWTVILGKSGCVKTTILRYLAGLLDDRIHWQGELVITDGSSSTNSLVLHDCISDMAQQDLLLPWLNVLDNDLNHRAWNDTLTRFALRPSAVDLKRYDDYAKFMYDKKIIRTLPKAKDYVPSF